MVYYWPTWGIVLAIIIFLVMVFWVLAITLMVVRFMRRGNEGGGAEKQTPLDIARERYAKGEITKEQYEQLKKDLS
jgi:putative membrane protein